MSFQNKVVIVTGASSGIGAATALLFAKKGANVVIVGRNEAKLKQVEETSKEDGNNVLIIKADVSKEDDAKRIIQETIEKYKQLDILINNAGIVRKGSIVDGKVVEVYDEVMNTNLRAPIHLTTLAAPHLIKTKGNIINVSSALGKAVLRLSDYAAYLTSKAALDHFSRSAAYELGAHGVRVNSVSPGPVATDLVKNANLDTEIESLASATVFNRISEPDEVANLIAFLASDKAVGITGSDYVVDNGWLL